MTISVVSSEKASKMISDNRGSFIDIRTVGETLEEHIADSVYVPFDLIGAKRLSHVGVTDKIPVLVCRSGSRAMQAAYSLEQEMSEVAVLDGGLVQWKKDGYPTVSGKKQIPLERQVLVAAGSLILLFSILGLTLSPLFLILTALMSSGMVFAGITGACGMARILLMLPWNTKPLCKDSCTNVPVKH